VPFPFNFVLQFIQLLQAEIQYVVDSRREESRDSTGELSATEQEGLQLRDLLVYRMIYLKLFLLQTCPISQFACPLP
jgi:hypothetical protein